MIQVIDGKVTKTTLPKVGWLSVSGYHLLPEEVLKKEGWLPEEEVKPLYDAEKERLVFDSYEILKTKVKKIYRVEPMPEPEPSELEELKETVAVLQAKLIEKEVISEAEIKQVK